MSSFPYARDVIPADESVLQLPDVAKRLNVSITSVHQMLRDDQLLALRRDGVVGVPEVFFTDTGVVKMLPGLITVMRDAKYTYEEILEWLFTEDDSLPGTPATALRGPLAREAVRRAAANPL